MRGIRHTTVRQLYIALYRTSLMYVYRGYLHTINQPACHPNLDPCLRPVVAMEIGYSFIWDLEEWNER